MIGNVLFRLEDVIFGVGDLFKEFCICLCLIGEISIE